MADEVGGDEAASPAGHDPRSWSEERKEAFLDHLAVTCSVRAACAALQMWPVSAYRLRRIDPEFAAAWRAALLTGYDRLEARLLALAGAATEAAEDELESDRFDPELAMRLLATHTARMKMQASGTARLQNRVRRATPEETDAAILKQLAGLDRRLKAKL